ncbi:MAG: anhydro-N-acetylmuramic acid kinase [Actinomycetota bacterium]|nr:anhydro-N-acetylmuramic acid kinase [Actinomycetota bacterium]
MRTTDEFGAPADTKEAIAFALIGFLSAHGLPDNVPSCTGAAGPRVLGTLTAGRDGIPAWPTAAAPARLV